MKNGASATNSSKYRGNDRSCAHHCALHSSEDILRVIYDYVKEGGGDSLRLIRLLDQQDEFGESPLMLGTHVSH